MRVVRYVAAVVFTLGLAAVACTPMPPPVGPTSTTTTSTTTTSTSTTTTSTTTTTVPPGPTGPRQRVAGGSAHTCAINPSGGVACWGLNNSGQLGSGVPATGAFSSTPVPVTGLSSGVVSLAASYWTTCALTSAGGVKCWGSNGTGQLGNGASDTFSVTPVDVTGLTSGVTALTAGTGGPGGLGHFCAVTSDTQVKCWGWNNFGQLGDGNSAFDAAGNPVTFAPIFSPAPVSVLIPKLSATVPLSGVVALAAGERHSCAVRTGGDVVCWGSNQFGQLGDGTTTWRTRPVSVGGLGGATPFAASAIAAGSLHTCVLVQAGSARCWGINSQGQLGDGSTTDRTSPVAVSGLAEATAIAAGSLHTCAIGGGAELLCWGANSDSPTFGYSGGALGDETTTDRLTPVMAIDVSGVTDLDGGLAHTCAIVDGETTRCTGWNAAGQLGDGTTTNRTSAVDVVGFP